MSQSAPAPASDPTLTEALLERGHTHRAVGGYLHEIVRISDGVVVTTVRANGAWEWIRAFDAIVARNAKRAAAFRTAKFAPKGRLSTFKEFVDLTEAEHDALPTAVRA